MVQNDQATTPHQRHQAEWAASAIPTRLAELNFQSYTDAREVDALLNLNTHSRWKHSDHLVPGWGVSGVCPKTGEVTRKGAQFKPDTPLKDPKTGKVRKYLNPYRQAISPLFLDTGDPDYWKKLLKDIGRPLIVTEGAKKAASVLGQNLPCISLPGVDCGGKKGRINKDLGLFCRYGRPMYLAFDRDIVKKAGVARALHRLGRMIAELGPMVYVLEWESDYKGIDDYIAAGHEVLPLLEGAKTLEEWKAATEETEDWNTAEKCPLALKYEWIEAKLKGRIRYNQLAGAIEIDGESCDPNSLRLELAINFNIPVGAQDCDSILLHLSKKNTYHPIKEYLAQCTREYDPDPELLDSLAADYLGADSELHCTYLRKTLIAAVARALDPGCKVDTVCILQGPQGARKSSFWKELASADWFDDSFGSSSDKDERLKIHQCWFVEWAELESVFRRKDVSTVKAFLTTTTDAIRPPYGKTVEQWKRPSIIVGSTNFDEFLSDPTGSRRFWVIPLNSAISEDRPIDLDKLIENRDRIWAAATHAYLQGEKWTLPQHLIAAAREANQAYAVSDPWEELIEDYVGTKPYVTSREILTTCIKADPDKQNRAMEMRCSNILSNLGWNRKRCRREGKNRQYWFPPSLVGTEEEMEQERTVHQGILPVPTSVPTSVPTPVPTPKNDMPVGCDSVTTACDNQGVPTVPSSNPTKLKKEKYNKKDELEHALKIGDTVQILTGRFASNHVQIVHIDGHTIGVKKARWAVIQDYSRDELKLICKGGDRPNG